MSKFMSHALRARTAATVGRFLQRTEGVAAVEFALILPLMVALFMGVVEMSQAVTANRRVTQVGSTAGDLVARYNGNISATDITDIMKVSSFLLDPYKIDGTSTLKVDVSVVSSSSSNADDTKQKWICTYDSAVGVAVTCTCPNTAFVLPGAGSSTTRLLTTSDNIVVATVQYKYKPLMFNFASPQSQMGASMGGSMGKGLGHAATYTMNETVYLKPRANCPQITKADASTCGC